MQALGALIAAAVLVPQHATATPFGRLVQRAEPVFCASARGRSFALTFDDGPSPYTPAVARVLRQAGARATFFLIGSRIALFPDGARAAAGVGAIGNHTWSHPDLRGLSIGAARRELVDTQRAIRRSFGFAPRLFRPPFDRADPELERLARELNLLDVRWSVDSEDSRPGAGPRAVWRTVRAGIRPGAVILLHDLHPWTATVVRRALRVAERKGLQAVSLPDLLAAQPPSPRQLGSEGAARCPP